MGASSWFFEENQIKDRELSVLLESYCNSVLSSFKIMEAIWRKDIADISTEKL